MLKKRDQTVANVRKQQTRYLKKSYEFGKELPKSVKQALALDAKNFNNLWGDAITKVLENVKMACKFLPCRKKTPIGHQFV